MKTWIVLAAALLLLWKLVLYDDRAKDTASTRKHVDDSAQQTRARSELPKQTTTTPEARLDVQPKPDQLSADQASTGQASADQAQKQAAPPGMHASGHFERMRSTFESEARDMQWASEQESLLPKHIAEAGFPDEAFDRNVTCRKTICRLSLRIAEDDLFALMKLAAKVQTSAGLSLAYGAAEVGDKRTSAIATTSAISASGRAR
jgi:hypothetical protein